MTSFAAVIEERDGTTSPREFTVERMYNLGSATRDPEVAVRHQEEVAAEGVRIAFDVPAPRIYPIASQALTADTRIGVHGPRTSGEVEIVLVVDDDVYVGVGSDHTDRDLERVSIAYSKQACPNILAPRLWRLSDVAEHWDSCVLESWVDGELYQQTPTASFLTPEDLLSVLRARADVPERGVVLFAGTIVSVTGTIAFGSRWDFRLSDPVLDRALEHAYEVEELLAEVREGYRVPMITAAQG